MRIIIFELIVITYDWVWLDFYFQVALTWSSFAILAIWPFPLVCKLNSQQNGIFYYFFILISSFSTLERRQIAKRANYGDFSKFKKVPRLNQAHWIRIRRYFRNQNTRSHIPDFCKVVKCAQTWKFKKKKIGKFRRPKTKKVNTPQFEPTPIIIIMIIKKRSIFRLLSGEGGGGGGGSFEFHLKKVLIDKKNKGENVIF